jgi:choline dehydrogenase-like flavoprotein
VCEERGEREGIDEFGWLCVVGYSYLNSLTGSDYDWKYNTVAQADVLGREMYWPRGKGVGGSGAINGESIFLMGNWEGVSTEERVGLFWCRGSSMDYDAWGSKSISPLLLHPSTDPGCSIKPRWRGDLELGRNDKIHQQSEFVPTFQENKLITLG